MIGTAKNVLTNTLDELTGAVVDMQHEETPNSPKEHLRKTWELKMLNNAITAVKKAIDGIENCNAIFGLMVAIENNQPE